MLFAWTMSEAMQYAVRGGAALVGLVVGWFVMKPLANVLSRLAFQRPVAPEILPLIRAIGAVGLAILLYFTVPVGTGIGTGDGSGGGAGKDKSSGKDKSGVGSKDKIGKGGDKDSVPVEKGKKADDVAPDLIRVEIVGGVRYPGKEKWYLFQRKEPPLDKVELKDRIKVFLKEAGLKSARLQPVIMPDTVAGWNLTRGEELREIRLELGLQPVDHEEPKLSKEK